MAEKMTQGEWKAAGFAMVWSITDRESCRVFDECFYPNHESFCEAFDAVELDLSAPDGLEDGTYRVYHKGRSGRGWGKRVVVSDGHFDPVPTERAVLNAVAASYGLDPVNVLEGKAGLDYRYIESLRWDAECGALDVVTGS